MIGVGWHERIVAITRLLGLLAPPPALISWAGLGLGKFGQRHMGAGLVR